MSSSVSASASSSASTRGGSPRPLSDGEKAQQPAQPHHSSAAAACAEQFQVQGMRHEPHTDVIWCALCTVAAPSDPDLAPVPDGSSPQQQQQQQHAGDGAGSFPRIEDVLCVVGRTAGEVLAHCQTRGHLLRFERARFSGLQYWCPVQLHGERVLLDHHCVYPSAMFGPGRLIMDETIAGGMLLGEDVCGAVKLWPYHRYSVVELVLPQSKSFVERVELDRGDGKKRGKKGRGASTSGAARRAENGPAPHLDVFYAEDNVPEFALTDKERHAAASPVLRTAGAKRLPLFQRRLSGVRSRRMQANDVSRVLREVNTALQGEAIYRKRRIERFARENI